MTLARAAGIFAALVLGGCGGADPAPKAPAAAPVQATPARVENTGDACNELLLGVQSLKAVSDPRDPALALVPESALTIRDGRQNLVAFADFRARLKNVGELDKTMASDAQSVDQLVASRSTHLEESLTALEGYSAKMRDAVADIEQAFLPFYGCTSKKNPDCAASLDVATGMPRTWITSRVVRSRAEIARPVFKSADLDAKRSELLKRIDVAIQLVAEQEKLDAQAPKDAGDIKAAMKPLLDKCAVQALDVADMVVRKTDWIVAKDADLRKLTMVVQVLPEGRMRARLGEWAAASTGMMREAFEGATLGGFGSGFYVVPKDGEVLIVTNRHVVAEGDRATLVAPDGTQTAAEILYTDPRADLAVLKPAKPSVTAGLGLEPTPPKDQEVVIATGYPGLAATPSYQTTRGYVSNQHFVDSYDHGIYIQHTAPLDKGSSGGPLTTEKGTVLGVNTLKIHDRENVAMSVPASAVARAVARATWKPSAEDLRQEARSVCLDVIAEIGSIKPNINTLVQRISLAMVSESGSTAFNQEAKYDRELADLLYEEPVDALRYAIVDRLTHDAFVSGLSPFETCAAPNADDFQHIETMDRVRFQIRAGAATKELVLRREHGRFQLLRFELAPPLADIVAKPAKKPKPAKKSQAAQK